MTSVRNGNPGNRPARRYRFDEYPPRTTGPQGGPLLDGHSGRRAVIGGLLTIAILAGGLSLAFREWRSRYRERAAFGAREVATAIDPMAALVPPDVPRGDWGATIAETHAMLVTLTASNLLDLDQMRALRTEVSSRVSRTRPETAFAELSSLWNDLYARSGPVLLQRHPRPALLRQAEIADPFSQPGGLIIGPSGRRPIGPVRR
jgi:hypothetical protein